MKAFRICQSDYKDDLSGTGSYLYGGRWNSKGRHGLYCACNISLAVLELVVNFSRSASPLQLSYHLLELELPDDSLQILELSKLKKDWAENEDYTRFIGDHFLENNQKLGLIVPSAVVPEENNILLNPNHNLFNKIKITKSVKYGFDKRLLN